MNKTWAEFKKFVNKGNILELAIGVIVGAAFSTMLNSLVYDIFMPFISKILDFDLTGAKWILKEQILDIDGETILQGEIAVKYGQFIQYVINFLVISVSIFVGIKIFRKLTDKEIKRKIRYLEKLKAKHPDWFDEATDYGTKAYERLKALHPDYFKEDVEAQKIEQVDAKIEQDPVIAQLELLSAINEKLDRLAPVEKSNKGEKVD